MRSIKKLGAALTLSAVMAGGLGTVGLEAKGKSGGSGQAATCAYLLAVMTYPNTSPSILVYAVSLYNRYSCSAQ